MTLVSNCPMLQWLVRKCASMGLRRKSKIREAGLGFVDKRSEVEVPKVG